METHDQDPKAKRDADPWESVSTDFSGIGKRLRETYRKVADETGPSEEEIKQAFGTLAAAWDQVSESVTTALRDPDLREQIKEAVGSFASAVGSTITELGSELRHYRDSNEEE
ncbi:MAG: hypothetical protein WBM90_08535 [Acidimicrobiia bacterium]